MIARIRSSLIEKADRLPIQRHKLALEAEVVDARDVVLAVTPVIDEE